MKGVLKSHLKILQNRLLMGQYCFSFEFSWAADLDCEATGRKNLGFMLTLLSASNRSGTCGAGVSGEMIY